VKATPERMPEVSWTMVTPVLSPLAPALPPGADNALMQRRSHIRDIVAPMKYHAVDRGELIL
jgi:hypothetical protein